MKRAPVLISQITINSDAQDLDLGDDLLNFFLKKLADDDENLNLSQIPKSTKHKISLMLIFLLIVYPYPILLIKN